MLEDVVVTGTLVNSSAERLMKLSQFLFLLHFCYFVFRLLYYSFSDSHQWICFILTFALCGIYIPLCGYVSAVNNKKSAIALFSGIQCCLSFLSILDIVNTTLFLTIMNDGCEVCTRIFKQGNESCQYNWEGQSVQISRADCNAFPSLVQIGLPLFFMTSISGASCYAALTAHQILNEKHVLAQIIHTTPELTVPPIGPREEKPPTTELGEEQHREVTVVTDVV